MSVVITGGEWTEKVWNFKLKNYEQGLTTTTDALIFNYIETTLIWSDLCEQSKQMCRGVLK